MPSTISANNSCQTGQMAFFDPAFVLKLTINDGDDNKYSAMC